MNIAVYGAGGVGGYFGARLAQVGNNVTFIARGKHLEAIQKNGLQLKSIKGDFLLQPAKAVAEISEVKNIDLILICVKTWQLVEVAEKIKPILNSNTLVAVLTGQIILWSVTYINTRGIKEAGVVQVVTTVLKIAPLFLVGFCGLFFIEPENFTPLNISESSNSAAITAVAAFTLFSFLGLESATVPSNIVTNPGRTIPRATYFGLAMTFLIYFLGSMSIMGMIPSEQLMHSPFPYSEAAAIMWGPIGGTLVTIGAVFSTLGALNGWILIQGQVPYAIATDRLFPKVFAKLNSQGVPATGLIISCVFVSIMMMMNYSDGLVATYSFFILLSTFLVLVPYLFTVAAYGILVVQEKTLKTPFISILGGLIAFLFSLWAIIGSGQESVFYGFIILMAGIPVYIYMKASKTSS